MGVKRIALLLEHRAEISHNKNKHRKDYQANRQENTDFYFLLKTFLLAFIRIPWLFLFLFSEYSHLISLM